MIGPILMSVVKAAEVSFGRKLIEHAAMTAVSAVTTMVAGAAVERIKDSCAQRTEVGSYTCSYCGNGFQGIKGTCCKCPWCGKSFNLM